MAFASPEMERPRHTVNATPPAAGAALRRRCPRAARVAPALALAAGLAAALPGCSLFESPVVARGHRVTEEQIRDITPGVHTRADVQALLGSPTASSTFGDGSWYYISSRTRQRPGRALQVRDQETVAVDFDGRGVVRGVRVLTEADARSVEMVSRETPTPGNERTLLQALFGNVGRFGPGALAPTQEASPGAPAPTSTGR
jgi:outer membrane protein assembly factor BamE (lipoprotein component of BamABCDE complex)